MRLTALPKTILWLALLLTWGLGAPPAWAQHTGRITVIVSDPFVQTVTCASLGMIFPGGVQAYVVVNSSGLPAASGQNFGEILAASFDKAFADVLGQRN